MENQEITNEQALVALQGLGRLLTQYAPTAVTLRLRRLRIDLDRALEPAREQLRDIAEKHVQRDADDKPVPLGDGLALTEEGARLQRETLDATITRPAAITEDDLLAYDKLPGSYIDMLESLLA